MSPEELIAFRPHRLVLHELIVRITADIVVREGENEEDLGINFRNIANLIFSQYIIPALMQIEHAFDTMRTRIEDMTSIELEKRFVTAGSGSKAEIITVGQTCSGLLETRQRRRYKRARNASSS